MKNSGIAKECALNSCKSINLITGLGLKLTQRADKKIDLICEKNRQVDSWASWDEARIALWTSFMVVEASFLKNTLLADSASVERKLAATEKKLTESTTELKSVQAERDLYLQASVRFARLVDLNKGIA